MSQYYFSAGPAVLPRSVLKQAQASLLDIDGRRTNILELSHRSQRFEDIIQTAEELLRELMAIPDNYRVLFLQGGASTQFSMLPLNVARGKTAYYQVAGHWGKKAYLEALTLAREIEVKPILLASSEADAFEYIPTFDPKILDAEAAYVHITTNNTIEGTALYDLPQTNGIPLVADMSSNILTYPYQVEDFAMIYASAQKNMGPAGVIVVIIDEDFLNQEPTLSSMWDYRVQAEAHSLYNTPPTFSIYVLSLVLDWLKGMGGVAKMAKRNQEKAQLLYDYLDQSRFYHNPVRYADQRSMVNVPFTCPNPALDALFIQEAEARGLYGLQGHSSVGGMRASLYNAFPKEGVLALIEMMAAFEAKYQ